MATLTLTIYEFPPKDEHLRDLREAFVCMLDWMAQAKASPHWHTAQVNAAAAIDFYFCLVDKTLVGVMPSSLLPHQGEVK